MTKEKFENPIIKPFENCLKMLKITSDEITDAIYEFDLPPLDLSLKLELESGGIEIEGILKNKDISFSVPHEYFLFKSRPVLVYIRDQYVKQEDYEKNKLNRFHFCFCKALEKAKHEHHLESRYIVTTNTSGKFFVNIAELYSGELIEEGVYKKLNVCQECLREVNWKNFLSYCGADAEWWTGGNYRQRKRITETFSIKEFLKSTRRDLFSGTEKLSAGVARNEYILSQQFKDDLKFRRGYRCEECNKVTVKSDLQIHHRNHNRGDNSSGNLMVLCTQCHQNLHRREGGYIGDSK